MPLKFVHTADWHLGSTYWGIGARAAESARWRFDAVRRIWQLAADEGADFILAAGDLFDSDTPSEAHRRAALDLLADCPVPLYFIAGNHDPVCEGSVWRQPVFAQSMAALARVHGPLRAEATEIASGAVLFPCPVTRKYSREDATSWIPAGRRGQEFRIGLAHGGWQGYFGERGAADAVALNTIESGVTERAGLDYLALGDYHSYTAPDHPASRARARYAGTPEVTARDDARAGFALLVEIERPGAEPLVTPHRVGRVGVHDAGRVVLRGTADFEALQENVAAVSGAEDSILRLRLAGLVSASLNGAVDAWLLSLRERFLGVDLVRDGLESEPEEADFKALRLERVEEAIYEALREPLPAEALAGQRGAAVLAQWSDDPAARRAAISLYYQLLGGGG